VFGGAEAGRFPAEEGRFGLHGMALQIDPQQAGLRFVEEPFLVSR
jgi:hypothetical protein